MTAISTSPAEPIANLLKRRMAELGLTPADLSEAFQHRRTSVVDKILSTDVVFPIDLIEPAARVLQLDPRSLLIGIIGESLPILSTLLDRHCPLWSAPAPSLLSGDLQNGLDYGFGASSLIGPDGREIVGGHSMLGIPSLRLRQFLLQFPDGFTTSDAAEGLILNRQEASGLLVSLERYDYVRRSTLGDPSAALWQLGPDGQRLIEGHAPDSLSRKAALKVLDTFLSKITKLNAEPSGIYRVTGITVLGELVNEPAFEFIPFVEVMVIVGPRHRDPALQAVEHRKRLDLAREQARQEGYVPGPGFDRTVLRSDFERAIRDFHESVCVRFRYEG